MKLETKVFEFCNGKYVNLTELARAMGISVSQVYRVRQGKRPINQKFIIGTMRAFPEYTGLMTFFISPQREARMTNNRNDLGKMLKQQRVMIQLTLRELASAAGVSSSHLGRIESGQRFPSAHILRRIAKPLGFGEGELLTLAGYLAPQEAERPIGGRLDPYVAAVLSQEPVEIQRAVITVLSVLKSMAKGIA